MDGTGLRKIPHLPKPVLVRLQHPSEHPLVPRRGLAMKRLKISSLSESCLEGNLDNIHLTKEEGGKCHVGYFRFDTK